ncbi:MFS general substrate transporter [Trametes cingulata]|nr:MFS general substrate transporter [Trametes cingulata]
MSGAESTLPRPTKEKDGEGDFVHLSRIDLAEPEATLGPPVLTFNQEKRLWRKIDRRLIPTMTLLYLVSFLDRGNIGNAKLQGLLVQLNLTGEKYTIALTMYYLFYCIFNVPANLVIKKFPGLGYNRDSDGVGQNLVGLRICLGIAESGLSPGIFYLLTLWYPRHMLQWRLGLFWGGATVSGAFSGLLAYGISFISGTGGLLGWSWIFIIEGLITIVTALVAFLVFVDLPETATFLTPEERSFLINRLKLDKSSVGEEEHFEPRQLTAAFLDWKIFAGGLIDCTNTTTIYSTSLFLPSIINGFGYGPAISQLLTVPPYVLATVVVVVCSSYSDSIKMRSPFILGGLLLTSLGLAIILSDVSIGVKYFALYFVVVGSYQGAPMIVGWLGNNLVGHYKRGIGLAMQVTMSNFGGFIASGVYRVQDAPRYREGHIADLTTTAIGLVLVSVTAYVFWRSNMKRDARQLEMERQCVKVEYTAEELRRMGERAPDFRYTL